jgi:alkylation response protein AidB-like acyl-CoA dehydrogenase
MFGMSDTGAFADARRAFDEWRHRYPVDLYESDWHLDLVNRRYLDGDRLTDLQVAASEFGKVVAVEIGPLVESYRTHLPELAKYDGHGNHIDEIRFHDAYHESGRRVWATGLLQRAAEAGNSFEQANLFYLASLEGEMGHMCAATCTTGLVRVLRRHASTDLKGRYLPGLTAGSYDTAVRGAQFLTEVQGGSDVGANASVARDVDGSWEITGEKWFCSVADAGLFLLLARPEGSTTGTRGLACFVVPRTVEGRLNGFSIRRLKDKLGTTAMASGEIDFDRAAAELVGEVDAGFKIMVTAMLNTSRWMNAVGDVGIMRRAYLEASNYAAVREAFGQRIADFPLVRRQLAEMKAEWLAGLHSTWELTSLDEAIDIEAMGGATGDQADIGFHRYLVNANKLVCSLAATDVVRRSIEILGGNGAIEEFSVLPRLLRDAVVYEQWEGTHNVLTAQVLRDMGRLGLAGTVVDRTATTLKGIADNDLGLVADRTQAVLEDLSGHVARCTEEPEYGALHFRSLLERLLRVHQVGLLLKAAEDVGSEPFGQELAAAAELILGRYLEGDYRAESDPRFEVLVERMLGSDLD